VSILLLPITDPPEDGNALLTALCQQQRTLIYETLIYDKRGKLTLDDLAETEIDDWMTPQFRASCSYAASQGWLIVQDDVLTLTTAGLAAA
jgi:hypothetical protein